MDQSLANHRPKPDAKLILGMATVIIGLSANLVYFAYSHGRLEERVAVDTGMIIHQQEEIDSLRTDVQRLSTIITQEAQQVNDLERYHQLTGAR